MTHDKQPLVILFADICGSSPIYARVGNTQALELIGTRLDRMASIVRTHGGAVIRSKGDDLLCTFTTADAAVQAACDLVTTHHSDDLQVRAGAHRGEVVRARGDIFGDAVNLAARLLDIARPNEVVVTDALAEDLSEQNRTALKFFSRRLLKGQSSPVDLYSVSPPKQSSMETLTVMVPRRTRTTSPRAALRVECEGREWICVEGMTLSIGRSDSCDIVVNDPHISREHATIEMRDGKAILSDRSSGGTWVAAETGAVLLRRESTFLVGRGEISLGDRDAGAGAMTLRYEQHSAREATS